MIHLSVAIGCRPHFIKLGCILRASATSSIKIIPTYVNQQEIQDYDYYSIIAGYPTFTNLNIDPFSYHQAHEALIKTFTNTQAHACLVIGDTKASYAAARAAHCANLPLIHFESGMRTIEPTIEEKIRRYIDHKTKLHLCCHEEDRNNLLKEGIPERQTRIVGSLYLEAISKQPKLETKPVWFISLHRKENLRCKFINSILEAAHELADENEIIFSCHPTTTDLIDTNRLGRLHIKIKHQGDRVEFLGLLRSSAQVITDSAGIAEESVWLGIPTVIARQDTERPWLLNNKCSLLGNGNLRDAISCSRVQHFPKSPLPASFDVAKNILEAVDSLF